MVLWSPHTKNTRLISRRIIFDLYDLFDHDTWTSRHGHILSILQHLQYQWPWISLRGHLRSMIFCTNRKHVYDFLLVLSNNLGHTLPHFRACVRALRRAGRAAAAECFHAPPPPKFLATAGANRRRGWKCDRRRKTVNDIFVDYVVNTLSLHCL